MSIRNCALLLWFLLKSVPLTSFFTVVQTPERCFHTWIHWTYVKQHSRFDAEYHDYHNTMRIAQNAIQTLKQLTQQ